MQNQSASDSARDQSAELRVAMATRLKSDRLRGRGVWTAPGEEVRLRKGADAQWDPGVWGPRNRNATGRRTGDSGTRRLGNGRSGAREELGARLTTGGVGQSGYQGTRGLGPQYGGLEDQEPEGQGVEGPRVPGVLDTSSPAALRGSDPAKVPSWTGRSDPPPATPAASSFRLRRGLQGLMGCL